MARGKEYSYEITEIIGSISEPNDRTNWCKAILKTLLNKEDEGIDIRKADLQNKVMGSSGIRLTDDETHKLVDLLLENGYGSFDAIKTAYKNRQSLFYSEEEKVD